MEFLEYIESTQAAQSVEELFSIYTETVAEHGLDKVLFALETDHNNIGLKAGHGVVHSYPMDWMQYYLEKGYDKIDPVRCYGLYQQGAFSWEEMNQNMTMTKTQNKCLNMGIESGLNNGIAVAIRGSSGELAGMALASSEKKDSFDGNMDLINAFTYQFYNIFNRLVKESMKKNNEQKEPIKLTNMEYEVLTWLALGKTKPDISDILNVSVHTVDFHLRNIFKKLNANSQILAIVKAISMGLIYPYPYR